MTAATSTAPRAVPASADEGGGSAGASAEGASLGNDYGTPFRRRAERGQETPTEQRNRLHALRDYLHGITGRKRLSACGRHGVFGRKDAPIGVRLGVDDAGRVRVSFTGLAMCACFWLCAVCAQAISMNRFRDVSRIFRKVSAADGSVGQLTLTIRHRSGDSLIDLWSALSAGWRAVTSGRAWEREQGRYGIRGWIKAVELKISQRNGWHIHIHAYMVFDRLVSPELFESISVPMWERWAAAVERKGFESWFGKGGFKAQLMDIRGPAECDAAAAYCTKAAFEASSPMTKVDNSEADGTPDTEHLDRFDLLEDAMFGDTQAVARWRELEKASKGRESFRISRSLRVWAAMLPEEPTDEERLADEEQRRGRVEIDIDAGDWRKLVKLGRTVLLTVAEAQSDVASARAAVQRWLDEHGIRWSPTPKWEPFPFEDDPFKAEEFDPPF